MESELITLTAQERKEYLESINVRENECGLQALVRLSYQALDLQTYFTCGPQESKAWTIRKGMTAPQAAGVIHSDFEKGFIKAEIISYDDLIKCGNEKAAKDSGLIRSEGKEYKMQEGDIALFRFNV